MGILEDYENGDISAPEAFIQASKMIKLYTEIKDLVYEKAIEEAREFNKDEVYFGMTWEIRSGKTTYDFEASATYKAANDNLKKIRKDLTNATKALETGKGFFDKETGDVAETVRIKSVSKDVLTFKSVVK